VNASLLTRAGFVAGMSLLFAWGISFIAPSPEPVQPTTQIVFPDFSATDWVMVIGVALAIPLTLTTVWVLQVIPISCLQVAEEAGMVAKAPSQERPIIFNGAAPEVVNRLKAERNEWKRKYRELLQARPAQVQEPERELSYRAVIALLEVGNVGIKQAREIVRQNGGMVGREGYAQLQQILTLLPPPIDNSTPTHTVQPTVNREPSEREPREPGRVNHKARLPRAKRGW
jgi:low affinity Fe/Cu permease